MRLQANLSTKDKRLNASFGAFQNISDGGYERGLQEGKQAEWDRFWDSFQQNGNRDDYQYAFYRAVWTDDIYNPKYPMVGHMGSSFNGSQITDTKVPITVTSGNMRNAFNQCALLKRIPSLILRAGPTDITNTFAGCVALEEIHITGDGRFNGALSFADSPLLTDASVRSVIDHLKDLTGAAAKTLTFHAEVGARLTEEQKVTITAKNWTLVY